MLFVMACVLALVYPSAPFGWVFVHRGSLGVWSDPGLALRFVRVCVCGGAVLSWKGRSDTF